MSEMTHVHLNLLLYLIPSQLEGMEPTFGRIIAAFSLEVKLGSVEHISIVEWHVMAVTSKYEPHAVMHVG